MSNEKSNLPDLYKKHTSVLFKKILETTRKHPYLVIGTIAAFILAASFQIFKDRSLYTQKELIEVLESEIFVECNGFLERKNSYTARRYLKKFGIRIDTVEYDPIVLLSMNSCKEVPNKVLRSIKNFPYLSILSLTDMDVDVDLIAEIRMLEYLALSFSNLENIDSLHSMKKLSGLHLVGSNFPKDGFEEIDKLDNSLNNTKISFFADEELIDIFEEESKKENCDKLILYQKKSNEVKKLNDIGWKITGNPEDVVDMNIEGCSVNKSIMRRLNEFDKLQMLYLNDLFLEDLSFIKKLDHLKYLFINNSKINNYKHLIEMVSLKLIHFSNMKLNEKDKYILKESLPNIQIIFEKKQK